MSLFFIFDEWSDVSDEKDTRRQADAIMDALRNPYKPRPQGEWVGGEATRQFVLHLYHKSHASHTYRTIDFGLVLLRRLRKVRRSAS
jgi:uncharacterized protein (DUF2126 family)